MRGGTRIPGSSKIEAYLKLVDGKSLAIMKESLILDDSVNRDPSPIVALRIGQLFLRI